MADLSAGGSCDFDTTAPGTLQPPGVQLQADVRAMLEEQRRSLSREIRESLERQTQAIERLITQQGNLEHELKSMNAQRQTRSNPFSTWDSVKEGHGAGSDSDDGSVAEARDAFEVVPSARNSRRTVKQVDSADMHTRTSRACARLQEELEEDLRNRSWYGNCWRCPARARAWCKRRNARDCRQAIKEGTMSTTFDLSFGFLILCNAALIGAEVEYQAVNDGRTSPLMAAFQQFFGVVFLIELMLRLHAEGRKFLRPPGWKWNVFDLVLVSTFVADFASAFLFDSNTDMSSNAAGRILRAARFCRILRTLRLVRATSYAHEFRKMAYALQHSAHTLFWALLLLFVVIYCFATTFTQATNDFFAENKIHGTTATSVCKHDGSVAERDGALREVCELQFYWGTLPKSIYFLYASLSGGVNWVYVVNSLGHVDWTFQALFLIYISVSFFGVLNVVTSVFVECAMASTQHFMDIKIQEALNIKKMHVRHLQEVFRDVDLDGSGQIALCEMEELLKNEHLSAYLESIDIRKDDARLLFRLLDDDSSGQISIMEFCEGCLRLKGEAKSFDIHRLVWENKRMMKRFQQYTESMNSRMRSLSVAVNSISVDGIAKEKPSPSASAETALTEASPATGFTELQEPGLMDAPPDDLTFMPSPDEVEVDFHRHWGADAKAEIKKVLGEIAVNGCRPPTPEDEPVERPHAAEQPVPALRVEAEVFGI